MTANFILIRGMIDGTREMNKLLEQFNYDEKITNEEYKLLADMNYKMWKKKIDVKDRN